MQDNMTDIHIRPAAPEDAQAISDLNRAVQAIHAAAMPWRFKEPGPDTLPPEEIHGLLAQEATLLFLAEAGSVSAGYVYAEVVRRPETSLTHAYDVIYVHHISVDTQFRRSGAGTKLLDAVKDAAKSLGISTIALDVWSFNAEAKAFFGRNGLKPYNENLWNR
jgi:ribosomal protein S18 acetylase RimI-like enzyme